MPNKEAYMKRALALAKRGEGHTSPNPMVGCVVVKDGRIISEGWHERYGGFHAERNALLRCREDPAGADLYVTLEPCCHHGKTPPCTDIIIEKKIGRVFVGSMDSNPLVGGKGAALLREAGIPVETGILEASCRELNEVFFHFMETGMPFVVMKYAMTLDGKIACATGDSRWVTGETARQHVHRLRNRYAGIMAGIGTVLADDPMLNCRLEGGTDPVRIICDSALRTPEDARVVRTAREVPTIIVCRNERLSPDADEKIRRLEAAGVRILRQGGQTEPDGNVPAGGLRAADPASGARVDLRELMHVLAQEHIDSVLVEGGAGIHAAVLEAGLANRVYAYIAGKLVGGMKAPSPVGGSGIPVMADAVRLKELRTEQIGEDLCITGLL